MIVDLIDEVDFKERLIDMGVPLNIDQSLEEVQTVLSSWLQDYPEQRPCIVTLFEEIQSSNIMVLPDVSEVMQTVL
jgi:protein associated with RNAse G/E